MKSSIRKDFLNKRDNMSIELALKKSVKIQNKLKSLKEFIQAKSILFYVSKGCEVSTIALIEECFAYDMLSIKINGCQKQVILPRVVPKTASLDLFEVKTFEELEMGSFGILEPKKTLQRFTNYGNIDLIIVPGIAFDRKGNRIGYGKGFYDNLLKKTNGVSIALAYDYQVQNSVPKNHEDIPVDIIVTEKEVIYCKKK